MKNMSLEIKSAGSENPIAELKSAFDAHDRAVAKRLENLERKLDEERERGDELETAMKRVPLGGGMDSEKNKHALEEKAFSGFLRRGPDSLPEVERKALTVGSNTDGGYLVADSFEREVLKNLVEISPVRQAARVGQMSSSSIIIPRRTAAPTAYWVGETEARKGTQSAYGQVTIPANEVACYIDVSQQLLEDSAFSIEEEVAADVAEEFARIEGEAFTIGDSVNKPEGFLVNAHVPKVASGSATTITADGLIDFLYSLSAFYRNRSAFMMNSSTLSAVSKLKDGQGQYLWQPGISAGQPSTLLGRPVLEANDMPDISAGATPIVLGDFTQGYRIYDRVGMTVLRDPYTLASQGLVRFHCRRRIGAAVVKPEALRKLEIAASL